MLYKTHINTWITTTTGMMLATWIINPLILLSIPFLSLVADADHNKWLLSKNLKLKFWFLGHRNFLHSAIGLLIVNIILFISWIWLATLLWHFFWNWTITNEEITSIIWFSLRVLLYILVTWISFAIISKWSTNLLGNTIGSFINNIIGTILFIGLIYIIVYNFSYDINNIPLMLFAGFYFVLISHLIGDFFTNTGFPLFYPFSKTRVHFPITFSTGEKIENLIYIVLTLVNFYLFYQIFQITQTNTLNAILDYLTLNWNLVLSFVIIFILSSLLLFRSNLNFIKKSKIIFKNLNKIFKNFLKLVVLLVIITVIILGNLVAINNFNDNPEIVKYLLITSIIIIPFLLYKGYWLIWKTINLFQLIMLSLFWLELWILFILSSILYLS